MQTIFQFNISTPIIPIKSSHHKSHINLQHLNTPISIIDAQQHTYFQFSIYHIYFAKLHPYNRVYHRPPFFILIIYTGRPFFNRIPILQTPTPSYKSVKLNNVHMEAYIFSIYPYPLNIEKNVRLPKRHSQPGTVIPLDHYLPPYNTQAYQPNNTRHAPLTRQLYA